MPASESDLAIGTGRRFVDPAMNAVPSGGTFDIDNFDGIGIGYMSTDDEDEAGEVTDCERALAVCQAANAELEEEKIALEEEKAELCEELGRVSPNGSFSFSLPNANENGGFFKWYDYYTTHGSLTLLAEYPELADSYINFETTSFNSFLYREDKFGNIEYDNPAGFIALPVWVIETPGGSEITRIRTSETGTYTVRVKFTGDTGNQYPGPDYYIAGTFTVSKVDGETVLGFEDFGCDE